MEYVSPPKLELVGLIYNNGSEHAYDSIPVSIERTFTARIITSLSILHRVNFSFVGSISSEYPEHFLVVLQLEDGVSSYLNPYNMCEELFVDLCTQLNNMLVHANSVIEEDYAALEQHLVGDFDFDDTATVYAQNIESDHE